MALLFFIELAVIVADGFNDHVFNADVIIVLGNTVNPDGKPSSRLQARLDEAAKLYLQHKAATKNL